MSDHPIVHIELSSSNLAADTKFYSDLFGWAIENMPAEMNYATFETGDGPGGGFSPIMDSNPAGSTVVYVGTSDIEATLAKAQALGGMTLVPKTEIPGMGWFAIFADLTGNKVGLYTDKSQV